MVATKGGDFHTTKEFSFNSVFWRYLTLSKYIDLLTSKSVYFSRADFFDDPFEGIIYEINKHRNNEYISKKDKYKIDMSLNFDFDIKHDLENNFINCWHFGKYESQAMWDLYLNNNEGLAIKTTHKKLLNCLSKNVIVEKVRYTSNIQRLGSVLYPNWDVKNRFLIKDEQFIHEKEVRCIIDLQKIDEDFKSKLIPLSVNDQVVGYRLNIDLIELLDEIVFPPNTPDFVIDSIISITNKYIEFDNFRKSKYDITRFIDSNCKSIFPNGRKNEE